MMFHILVVDDEEIQRVLTRDCLEEEGFVVTEVADGDAALAAIRCNKPDAVLLDVVMPGRDGFDVCKEIRADPEISDIPIIMVTGSEDDASIRRAFELQVDHFVTKPVLWALLPHQLRFVLRAHQLKKDISVAFQKAEIASNAKTEFLAHMSHELRTPLNAIIGFSYLLLNGGAAFQTADKVQEYVGDIHNSGEHLLSVIDDVLDTVKVESGTMQISETPVLLEKISKQAIDHVGQQAEAANVLVVNRIGEDAPCLLVDESRIVQIITNLLSNAIKFSSAEDEVDVSFGVDEAGTLLVSVADNGPGIPEEDLRRIFDPFQQIEGSLARPRGGTGLGVPIARAMARLHGGDLAYESKEGEGTIARLSLPPERLVKAENL
jgi:signal transduction histidine kinase